MKGMFFKIKIKWLLNKAAIKFQKNNFLEAANLYKKILEIDSENFEANLWIGSLFAETNEYVKANEYLRKAIMLNSKNIKPYFNLALMNIKLMRFTTAVSIFENSINECNPGNSAKAEIYYNIGWIKFREKKYKDAIKYGNMALSLYPNYSQAEELILNAYQLMKK